MEKEKEKEKRRKGWIKKRWASVEAKYYLEESSGVANLVKVLATPKSQLWTPNQGVRVREFEKFLGNKKKTPRRMQSWQDEEIW